MSPSIATKLAVICYLSLSAEAFSSNNLIKTPRTALVLPSPSVSLGYTNKVVSNTFQSYENPDKSTTRTSTATQMSLSIRGGSAIVSTISSSPTNFFNANLIGLALITALIKISDRLTRKDNSSDQDEPKPAAIKTLQIKFLSVFWLLRCADWLQGPYFYEVYSSKIFNGIPASLAVVSKLFLTGFASTALFGPLVGRLSDSKGRKRGTLAFALLYSLGAATTKSNVLGVLLMGRVLSGIGTSLLFSAPEAWLVGEAMSKEKGGQYLGETFGLVSACLTLDC